MISTLHIKNIGIIDDLVIDLNNGLNVLTGETGAGKTLIIDSLGIIAGGRFSKEMIRKGESVSFVELCLYMPDNPNSIDENIIISREISTSGRNLCKINGRLVTVNELKLFMKNIIDIHGQYDNQTLMDTEFHTKYLDKFIGEKIESQLAQYTQLFSHYKELQAKLKNNYGSEIEKQRKLDLLQYQYKEIKNANLKQGEDEELEAKRKIIVNSEKVAESLNNVSNNLGTTAIDAINDSIRALEKINQVDDKYNEKLIELKNIYYEVQELSRDIDYMKDEIYFDEEERNETEERLDEIYALKRKYGNTIQDIINYKNEVAEEIARIEGLEKENKQTRKEIAQIEIKMNILCENITELRKQNSSILNLKINQELTELEMKNAKFNAKIIETKDFSNFGKSYVEFVITTNLGEDEKQLNKIASGGELSRIMLAIKTVLSDIDEVPVLIFDEIDTGISGKAANSVGVKLQKIAKQHQVIIVTHLATIAAKGDHNYYIYKEINNNKTNTKIKLLTEEETIQEIARISSGEITDIALSHAKELRKKVA